MATMNKIMVSFDACSPAPAGGYQIMYRLAGSSGAYINAGNFFNSPAVFYDIINPPGTCYSGFLRSVCGSLFGNALNWENCGSGGGTFDNSSCGTAISITTTDPGYVNLGDFPLHVDGSSNVALNWDVYDRPDRFTVYEDGVLIITTGWKGIAPYPGPWGASLSTAISGVINFAVITGRVYKVVIEVGPTGPPDNLDDNFVLAINCT